MALGPWITEDDKRAVMAVLDAGDLMSGKRVAQLEEQLAAYFGKRHCVAVSSGTAALECAFVATGPYHNFYIPVRDANFIAMLSAARAVGKPVRSPEGVGADILGVATFPYGNRVHDCAHRFDKGAAHAEVSCFSLANNKIIAAVGGFFVTNDSVVASTARQYRNHGRDGGPEIFREGRNLRMGEINAALALSQLKRIDEIMNMRTVIAHWYDDFTGQKIAETRKSWFLYPHYKPGHKQRGLDSFRLFNTATQEDRDTALYPIWPCMTREEVEAQCKS